jgi:LPXTG-motif cell wall-anchored protein
MSRFLRKPPLPPRAVMAHWGSFLAGVAAGVSGLAGWLALRKRRNAG